MELKTIIYVVAFIAYFIYKQYKKIQNEAVERKIKIEQFNNASKKEQSSFGNSTDSNKKVKEKVSNSKNTLTNTIKLNDLTSNLNNAQNQNAFNSIMDLNRHQEESDLLIDSNDEKKYLEIKYMVLYNELLKRPVY